jgi:hypothetical protein
LLAVLFLMKNGYVNGITLTVVRGAGCEKPFSTAC